VISIFERDLLEGVYRARPAPVAASSGTGRNCRVVFRTELMVQATSIQAAFDNLNTPAFASSVTVTPPRRGG
jgi:hypothetical protein